MADIIIRGMEMPENCAVLVNGHLYRCPLYDADGYCAKTGREALKSGNGVKRGRPEWCPLIELPEHGDLIDRSELSVVYYEGTEGLPDDFDHGVAWLLEHIDKLEPIIPASGGDA